MIDRSKPARDLACMCVDTQCVHSPIATAQTPNNITKTRWQRLYQGAFLYIGRRRRCVDHLYLQMEIV